VQVQMRWSEGDINILGRDKADDTTVCLCFVRACECVYVRVCLCVCECLCGACVFVCTCVCVCVCVCIYVCVCVYGSACVHANSQCIQIWCKRQDTKDTLAPARDASSTVASLDPPSTT